MNWFVIKTFCIAGIALLGLFRNVIIDYISRYEKGKKFHYPLYCSFMIPLIVGVVLCEIFLSQEALESKTKSDNQIYSLQVKLDTADFKIDSLQVKLDTANIKLDSIQGELDTANIKLDSIQGELDTANIKLDSIQGEQDVQGRKLDTINENTKPEAPQIYAVAPKLLSKIKERTKSSLDSISWYQEKYDVFLIFYDSQKGEYKEKLNGYIDGKTNNVRAKLTADLKNENSVIDSLIK